MTPAQQKRHRFHSDLHMVLKGPTHSCISSLPLPVSARILRRTFPECCNSCFAANTASNSSWVFGSLSELLGILTSGPKCKAPKGTANLSLCVNQCPTRRLSESRQNTEDLCWGRDAKFTLQTWNYLRGKLKWWKQEGQRHWDCWRQMWWRLCWECQWVCCKKWQRVRWWWEVRGFLQRVFCTPVKFCIWEVRRSKRSQIYKGSFLSF